MARPGWDPLGLADESELDSLVSKLEPPLPAEDTTFDWTIVAISGPANDVKAQDVYVNNSPERLRNRVFWMLEMVQNQV